MALEDDTRDFVVANFHSLEDQLLDCMRYVPFLEPNRAVVSPKFISILLDACSLIDSVLRDASPEGRHTFKQYAALHEPRLDLEAATTVLLVSPLQFLRPFKGWSSSTPLWWEVHNQVKHDRLRNYAAASYLHTITAVAALHQVLARSWDYLGNLTRAGWFNEASDGLLELAAARSAGAGPPDLPVQTRLFVSAIREDFIVWKDDVPTINWNWDFTPRVRSQLIEYVNDSGV